MKVSKKVLALVMSAAVVASIAAAGTLAYLTGQDTAVNTFTIGKVAITLDEAKVGPDGKKLASGERVKENEYQDILPGAVLDKDPVVTVEKGSADCYVYVAIRNCVTGVTEDKEVREYITYSIDDDENWEWSTAHYPLVGDDWSIAHEVVVYRYVGNLADENGVVSANKESVSLPTIFKDGKIYVDPELTAEDLEQKYGDKIVVKAFAIQADNLAETPEDSLDKANETIWDIVGEDPELNI